MIFDLPFNCEKIFLQLLIIPKCLNIIFIAKMLLRIETKAEALII